MKKFLLFILIFPLMGAATSLFADHARVMPKNVGRIYFAPSYQWGNKAFDNDASRASTGRPIEMFNLGLVLEHGVATWVTAALQWAPGQNFYSDIGLGATGSSDLKDMGDLFVGAKMQIVGPLAPVKSEKIRFSFAPGVKIPLTSDPDFTKEYTKMASGDDFTASKIDKHVLSPGWRLYFDYLFTKEFFVNFYNETLLYPGKGGLKNYDLTAGGIINSLGGGGDVSYGYDLTFEVEPNYTFKLSSSTDLELALPINYKATPAPVFELFGGAANALPALESGAKKSQNLTVRPTVGVFFKGWALPTEFRLGYFAPVWGKNTNANNTISAQIRIYYRI